MPLYYFDTIEGEALGRDPEGVELADETAARRMAWTSLSEVLADFRCTPERPLVILVSDDRRRPLYEVVAYGRGVDPDLDRVRPANVSRPEVAPCD